MRFGNTIAAKGWESFCQQAPGNTPRRLATDADLSRARPTDASPPPAQGHSGVAEHGGKQLACWQIEVTGGGRIWYLLDPDRRTVWITEPGTGHPKKTD